MVYSLARHCLQDEATAEEVAQEVFLELHRRIGEIESPVHLTRWLRRVAMNRCVDQSRRRRYRPRAGLESAPEPAVPASPADPLLNARLERLVAELPERARAIVILRFQEDLDPAEIAATLGIPVGTVKSNLHRSLAVLRARMERAQGVSK
jgi:RNA polymerase sigma-70 factor (ECF subfamily)